MERLNRPLASRDRTLLELYLIQAKRGILERPNWYFLLIVSGICVLIVYELWGASKVWPVIGILVLLTIVGGYLRMIWNARERYRNDVIKVEKLLSGGVIAVQRYTCTDALVFETSLDIMHIWALQIGPREVMIWPDYQYEYADILPSRTFDLIDDERLV